MKKARIVSNFRVEYRRKNASYQTEATALRWVRKFLDDFSIDHSSQIRHWQIEFFLSTLKKADYSYNDLLQSRSALYFLMDKVLKRNLAFEDESEDNSPGIFKVTG